MFNRSCRKYRWVANQSPEKWCPQVLCVSDSTSASTVGASDLHFPEYRARLIYGAPVSSWHASKRRLPPARFTSLTSFPTVAVRTGSQPLCTGDHATTYPMLAFARSVPESHVMTCPRERGLASESGLVKSPSWISMNPPWFWCSDSHTAHPGNA